MSIVKILHFNALGDERGSLIALEQNNNIPFEVKRIYYIFDTKLNVVRGLHAHKNLKQVAIALKGSCRFVLDNGKVRENVWLKSPNEGLLIDSCLWREMHDFSEDCVLMVIASEKYDESDYIRNYEDFLKECENDPFTK
ncbi:WxcM-like domain-containing protein [Vibrio vulnificus]|uniref:sugar 3,4-ketoisomerase n=1 Tax=Vibrio vulnificus TaxID=672 RepID=UPI001CDD018B|nr:FdtA/QdtA family cupin domain-containing protein [Vibrio vulnificus]EJB5284154.1 WxcM-like domain-containing protein [Vibrio vulnificus]EJE8537613.1 WxcM-like domain-containing protein [Vibrio vulnificus]EKA7340913.1 WxcM-like domain-containing protein [Vibrio vulnificus]ELX4125052.1 WxcM-like domain-containing protein [Vibrio vulnificus]MCA3898862.1 WxcM-like domain-containing protein [Vibrio vulnificus]